MENYEYQLEWEEFAYPENGAGFASHREAKKHLNRIDLAKEHFPISGPPVLIEGDECYTDNSNSHWLTLGYTRSKKTRCFIRPLLNILFRAGESSIILDVKGELSTDPVIRHHMEDKGITPVFLDFRNCHADGYNLMEYPLFLYTHGEKDKAMLQVANLVSCLMQIYHTSNSRADPFWENMSKAHSVPILQILLELAASVPELAPFCNLQSLGAFANSEGTAILEKIVNDYYTGCTKNAIIMLRSVLSAPDRTRDSIVSTTCSSLSDFLIQEDLASMLSTSTFDIRELYEKPTAVFLIIPDETSAFCNISGILLDFFYSQLVGRYGDCYQNLGKPPCRINFVIDEFCNARIYDMRSKISASGGRFMRWFLVCQSLNQMKESYPKDWSTIIGNCRNIMFLQSSDPDMLDYISGLCGKTWISEGGGSVPLVTPDDLKSLKKEREYKEAIYIRDDLLVFTRLTDIDYYPFLQKYRNGEAVPIPAIEREKSKVMTPPVLLKCLKLDGVPLPFMDDMKNGNNGIHLNADDLSAGDEDETEAMDPDSLDLSFDNLFIFDEDLVDEDESDEDGNDDVGITN